MYKRIQKLKSFAYGPQRVNKKFIYSYNILWPQYVITIYRFLLCLQGAIYNVLYPLQGLIVSFLNGIVNFYPLFSKKIKIKTEKSEIATELADVADEILL